MKVMLKTACGCTRWVHASNAASMIYMPLNIPTSVQWYNSDITEPTSCRRAFQFKGKSMCSPVDGEYFKIYEEVLE
jgi:hypothetical protein